MKKIAKYVLKRVFKEYQINRIYSRDISGKLPDAISPTGIQVGPIEKKEMILLSSDTRIKEHAYYAGDHAHGYGIWEDDDLVCMCWFWGAGHERIPGRFASLQPDEAIMVDLLTTEKCRGRGYAVLISQYAEKNLAAAGINQLWTWVWHNNSPSIRVFEKLGWVYRGILVEVKFAGIKDFLRFKLPRLK